MAYQQFMAEILKTPEGQHLLAVQRIYGGRPAGYVDYNRKDVLVTEVGFITQALLKERIYVPAGEVVYRNAFMLKLATLPS